MDTPKPKRGCEVVVESGDVFADGIKKIDLEIDAEYHRFLAAPEKWLVEYFGKTHNVTEEEYMKIKEFFGGLFAALATPFKKSTEDLKKAKDDKSVSGLITALGGIVAVAAETVEGTSKALKEAGVDVKSEDKHALAKSMVVSLATQGANKVIDLPGVSEDQEDQLFGAAFNGILDILIRFVVKQKNKSGWTL